MKFSVKLESTNTSNTNQQYLYNVYNMYAHKMFQRFECANRCLRKRKIRFNKWHIFLAYIHIKYTHVYAFPHYLIHFHCLSSKTISWALFTIELIKLADGKCGGQIFVWKYRCKHYSNIFIFRLHCEASKREREREREIEWKESTYYKNARMKWLSFTTFFVWLTKAHNS